MKDNLMTMIEITRPNYKNPVIVLYIHFILSKIYLLSKDK